MGVCCHIVSACLYRVLTILAPVAPVVVKTIRKVKNKYIGVVTSRGPQGGRGASLSKPTRHIASPPSSSPHEDRPDHDREDDESRTRSVDFLVGNSGPPSGSETRPRSHS